MKRICDQHVIDGLPNCDERFCIPNPGALTFQAQDAGGFHFTGWSHPQCQGARNPCTVLVALGFGNPDLTVTATISATATDTPGLSSSAAVNVTIDNTSPTLKLSGPADGAVFSPGAKAQWAIGAEDATTGPPAVQCRVVTQGQ